MTRDEICEIARSWKGTPFHKHAAVKGVGADCIGLVYGVGMEAGLLADYQTCPVASAMLGYSHRPQPAVMRVSLGKIFPQAHRALPLNGDILWVKAPDFPTHLAIFCDGNIIHAWAPKPSRKVIETIWDERQFKLMQLFAYPGFEGDE